MVRPDGGADGFLDDIIYIFVPFLFFLTISGLCYLKREIAKKTLSLREKIKEHKLAELALLESREELAEIFSMSLDLICIADINTATFLKVNSAFTRILDYPVAGIGQGSASRGSHGSRTHPRICDHSSGR